MALTKHELDRAAAQGCQHPDCDHGPECTQDHSGENAMIVAFVQGAQWWEYHKTGATMWASDRNQAEGEAETRATNGTLGKLMNADLRQDADSERGT